MLTTRFTERFGLECPIMSAPMALHVGGTLASAVSEAGALGSFGGVTDKGSDWVREQIALVRSKTDRPFAVGFITAFLPAFEQHFQIVLHQRVPVVAFSFGDPASYVERAKAGGANVICQVQTLEAAQRALDLGADAIVVQGNEAGGHTGTMNLLPFLSRVLDDAPGVPVLASGGIASGRSLAAVLAAGADGAWLGTALLATPEAIETSDARKERIAASDGQDTVFTTVFDRIAGLPWPEGIGERVQRSRFEEEWRGRDEELRERREELSAKVAEARASDDFTVAPVLMGQSATSVNAIRPAAEVVRAICEDAERILRERTETLTSD
jgi:nitronate monooxygenase